VKMPIHLQKTLSALCAAKVFLLPMLMHMMNFPQKSGHG